MKNNDDPTNTTDRIISDAMKRLKSRVRLSHSVVWLERLTQSFWLVAVFVLAAYASASWGVAAGIHGLAIWGAILFFAIASIWAVWRGCKSFRKPTETDAIRRLDLDLDGRPLSSLTDRMALGKGDPQAEYLWALHIQNMAARACIRFHYPTKS